jgi:hypothetical protein
VVLDKDTRSCKKQPQLQRQEAAPARSFYLIIPMRITARIPPATERQLDVDPDMTVAALIAVADGELQRADVVAIARSIVLDGCNLSHELSLRDCGVVDGSLVYVLTRAAVRVSVTTEWGVKAVVVPTAASLLNVKERLTLTHNIDADGAVLTSSGVVLDDDAELSTAALADGLVLVRAAV